MKLIKKFESFSLGSIVKVHDFYKNDELDNDMVEDLENKIKDAYYYLSDVYKLDTEPKAEIMIMNDQGDIINIPSSLDRIQNYDRICVDLTFKKSQQYNIPDFDEHNWGDFISMDYLTNLANDIKRIAEKSFNSKTYIKWDAENFVIATILPNE